MSRRPFAALLCLIGVLCAPTLGACSRPPAPTADRVEAALVIAGLPQREARCATRELFGALTTGQLRNLAERGSGALTDKTSTALSTALGKCIATTTPAAPPPSTTTP